MKMLEALRKRRSIEARRDAQAATSSPEEHAVPISDYDQLGDKEVGDRLSQLSQVELATVETYERAHRNRPAVLEKLRYMQGTEPLPGYDTLTTEQIAEALAGADAETVKAVRDYERKFQHRQSVLDEAARVLPASRASAGEERAREEKAALLREGYADRERTAPDPPE
jgi:glucose dehydrogenase